MPINVLMLGWELPPFNSGGLGTACLGLTEGLTANDVNIRFVVPKVFGSFPFNHMEVVSAHTYGDPKKIQRLLKLDPQQQQWISEQLAYGRTANSIRSKASRRRRRVDGIGELPVAPQTQANWYALQAAAIAEEDDSFEVIHTHDWMTYYGGIAARKVAASQGRTVPFVAQVHATEIDRCGANGDPAILTIERNGLQAADRVVAVSHYTKELVHREYGIPRQKISVVHNGIPTHKQPAQFDFHELKRHHKLVVFMGRITMQKGPDYFVKLAKAVTDQDPSVRFIMVGSGDMEKRCIEESARIGLTGKMLFSSFLRGSDVDRAYQLADLFVMPSVSEPFGIVALEAMQNGTPVLVSKQSGVAEVSEHIMKVNFWDIEDMRDAVLHTLHNPAHAAWLRDGGYRDVQNLSWETAAHKMRNIYEELLQQFSPRVVALEPVVA